MGVWQWLDGVADLDAAHLRQFAGHAVRRNDLLLRARTRRPLRHNPSALTQPPIPVARSPPRQLPCAPRATGAWAGRPGRLVRGKPQPTRPAAPARRRPRAAACRAIGRSPTKSDLVGWSFKCSPNADRARSSITPEIGINLTARPQLAKADTPFQGEARFQMCPSARAIRSPENVLYGLPGPWGKLWGFR